jgi:hypothetical protein
MWIPLAEAVLRAGSFEVLRPLLIDARILARCAGLYNAANGTVLKGNDSSIPADWWKGARVDLATGRVYFTTVAMAFTGSDAHVAFEVFAIGIELECAAVDARWPARPTNAPKGLGGRPADND